MTFENSISAPDQREREVGQIRGTQNNELNSISLLASTNRFVAERNITEQLPNLEIFSGFDSRVHTFQYDSRQGERLAQIPFLPLGPLTPHIDLEGNAENVRQFFNWGRERIDETLTRLNRVPSEDAETLLTNHNLRNSFLSNAEQQLRDNGVIRVGVIDDGSASHSANVISRIYASMPENMRSQVEVVLYDTTRGQGQPGYNREEARERAFLEARNDAVNKDIVALSVSGGLEPIGLRNLANRIGANDLNSGNRNQAFAAALENFSYDPRIQREMLAIREAASAIPVVTPIWNDGNTTPAALAGNVIVTSLRGNTRATQSELPDYYLNPVPGNQFSSQGPPRVIGAMLGLVGRDR